MSFAAAAPPVDDALPAHTDSVAPGPPAKISAYYSLVFPNITFFLQTLTVTIGRRCLPPSSTSVNGTDAPAASHSPVDVDLGPLKSVSRLHARIEYEEEEARFVLIVIGRNGAWIDGVWSGAGSRVPLGERSQIQIASRTFHFVLPPPATLDDSPSPSSVSSIQRARSPSVDVTSISPPSSLPSHSPSPRTASALPSSKPPGSPDVQLPNSDPISHSKTASASTPSPLSNAAPTSKKRKKASQPPPKPEVMPPKPPFTYAQLCYRAIKSMGGKATLQDICGWMIDNYDWYRYNEGAGWENSVRHNLSSGRAFKKMERSTGEHGKGFFWSVDAQYERTFEEQEARAAAQVQSTSTTTVPASGKDNTSKSSRKKEKAVPLDPPLKRSVKSGMGPLPPPLTSAHLVSSLRSASDPRPQPASPGHLVSGLPRTLIAGNVDAGVTKQETKSELNDPPRIDSIMTAGRLPSPFNSVALSGTKSGIVSGSGTPTDTFTQSVRSTLPSGIPTSSDSVSPFTALPPSVCLPIVIGPVPSSHPSSSTPEPPPIVLHNNTLVLSPVIFSSLSPEQLKALEEMGAQKALEVLQGHIVRYLKERMGKKKRKKVLAGGTAEKGGTKAGKSGNPSELSSLFTTAPLPSRILQSTLAQVSQTPSQTLSVVTASSDSPGFHTQRVEHPIVEVRECTPPYVDQSPRDPVLLSDGNMLQTLDVVDGDNEEGRVTKRRKLIKEVEVGKELELEASAAQISRAVDEDIEIEVC